VTKVVFEFPSSGMREFNMLIWQNNFPLTLHPLQKISFSAVCATRSHKLPDPKVIGNAGSFFQNPIVPAEQYETLILKHPGLISYPDAGNKRKLAAGWLIDQCKLKGQRMGNVGVYENQALVLS
jgi:UDP-N-acetylmuramate dehydrogenase